MSEPKVKWTSFPLLTSFTPLILQIRSESLPPQQPICTLAISLPEYTGESPVITVKKDTTPFDVRYHGALDKVGVLKRLAAILDRLVSRRGSSSTFLRSSGSARLRAQQRDQRCRRRLATISTCPRTSAQRHSVHSTTLSGQRNHERAQDMDPSEEGRGQP